MPSIYCLERNGDPNPSIMTEPMAVHELATGWQFRQADADNGDWLPVARVPTNVHLDLMANHKFVSVALLCPAGNLAKRSLQD